MIQDVDSKHTRTALSWAVKAPPPYWDRLTGLGRLLLRQLETSVRLAQTAQTDPNWFEGGRRPTCHTDKP